ncbi:CmcJ/NvfI family oxidoreductase [Novosphingobium bradum]|uniref:CmcJ/NvfI family oxidoreductase n=2 Tax=Novosphingobium bradum TaxID=1737444 RepID=A0ABV7IN82_9SPHN
MAKLNFARDRRTDYAFSNFRPDWRTLQLTAHEVPMFDARDLPEPPTLAREGFELHKVPVTAPRWDDEEWIKGIYIPLLRDLVLERTGGVEAESFPGSWVYRDTVDDKRAPAAGHAHQDRERENARVYIRKNLGDAIVDRHKWFENINAWRALTPPPQDWPLAFCDQRTNDPADWLIVNVLEPGLVASGTEIKHLVSLYNPNLKWYYFSNMQPDEVVLFRNYMDDPARPQGCMHTAFHDTAAVNPSPRASFELRLYVFHDD